jgi:preprotein translocase SecE subunit
MKAIINYFRESFAEINRVTWPTKTELAKIFLLTLIVGSLFAAFIGAFDALFNFTYQFLLTV